MLEAMPDISSQYPNGHLDASCESRQRMLEEVCPDTFSDACTRHSPPPTPPPPHSLPPEEALEILDAGNIDPSACGVT